ncbi:CaiB/BaiF CoA transferase family protein [Streptomyces sp. NPDC002845]
MPKHSSPSSSGPLSHIRVLDLSRVLAGPWAGQLLADMGADVIKVERPGSGDDTRSWGPPFLTDADGTPTHESAYYLGANRAKRSITVDLSKPRGQQIIRELAAQADILLENFKYGTLSRLGLGYEDLREVNPGLIYCSITGFGQTGPRRAQPAYDFAIQAMGGLMSVTGERDDRPGGGPQKVGVPIVDLTTGTYAAVAVLAALAHRSQTGLGDHIDLAMLDVQVATLANQAMNHLVDGRIPARTGNSHPNIQPQDVYTCKDGGLAVAVGNDGQFVRFCEALGLDGLAGDERFATNRARVRNLAELRPLIASVLAGETRRHWIERLDRAGVPCGTVNTVDEVLADEQVQHRGMVVDVPHPLTGSVRLVASPLRFANSPLALEQPPPLLGQHTDEVLRDLGVEACEIKALREEGVV